MEKSEIPIPDINSSDDVRLQVAGNIMNRILQLEATIKEQGELMDKLPSWEAIDMEPPSSVQTGEALTLGGIEASASKYDQVLPESEWRPEPDSDHESSEMPQQELSNTRESQPAASSPNSRSPRQWEGSCSERTALKQLTNCHCALELDPPSYSSISSDSMTSIAKASGDLLLVQQEFCKMTGASALSEMPSINEEQDRSRDSSRRKCPEGTSTTETLPPTHWSELLNVKPYQTQSESLVSPTETEPLNQAPLVGTVSNLSKGSSPIKFDIPSLLSIFEKKRAQRQAQAQYLAQRRKQLIEERMAKEEVLRKLGEEVMHLRSKLCTGST